MSLAESQDYQHWKNWILLTSLDRASTSLLKIFTSRLLSRQFIADDETKVKRFLFHVDAVGRAVTINGREHHFIMLPQVGRAVTVYGREHMDPIRIRLCQSIDVSINCAHFLQLGWWQSSQQTVISWNQTQEYPWQKRKEISSPPFITQSI